MLRFIIDINPTMESSKGERKKAEKQIDASTLYNFIQCQYDNDKDASAVKKPLLLLMLSS